MARHAVAGEEAQGVAAIWLAVETLRVEVLQRSLGAGGADSQYVNTPSCQRGDWARRYFGHNYAKLLQLKRLWDPDNIFNYCQSVGSVNNTCCGY